MTWGPTQHIVSSLCIVLYNMHDHLALVIFTYVATLTHFADDTASTI